MERITSLQNSKVKNWCKLHQKKERDQKGLFLIEGEHLIGEAQKAGVIETVITDEGKLFTNYPTVLVTSEIMKKISTNVSSVHYIAVCHKNEASISHARRVLLLDGVQDPGNLGTLIRTAVSFQFDAVYCSQQTVDLYNDKTIRSTQGALFHIPVIYCDLLSCIKLLQEDGFAVVATSLRDAKPLRQMEAKEKMAFVMGNEGQGVSEAVMQASDERLFIEMQGFESLNVAVAAGIVMYTYQK